MPYETPKPYDELPPHRVEPSALDRGGNTTGHVLRYYNPKGADILGRNEELRQWIQHRGEAGLFQFGLYYKSVINHRVTARNQFFRRVEGIDFTTVDYLGLSCDPRLVEATVRAAKKFGVHSVSVGALSGNYPLSEQLEHVMCEWLGYKHCVLFPTGWAASFGAITGLVRAGDFVVMDEYAHASLQQGAYFSTGNVVKFRHMNNADAAEKIGKVRLENPQAGILVVTEGMYSMDGDVPELQDLVRSAKHHDAYVLVDVCHDLAATGPHGTGTIGTDNLLGEVDVVVGAFSKALGTNGGFMLVNDLGAALAVKFFGGSYTYSTAMTPPQVAVALEAISIARSTEGQQLRENLSKGSEYLRTAFSESGCNVYGDGGSHIVPVHLGGEGRARLAGGLAFQEGIVATVIEFPVVSRGKARFRFSMKPEFELNQLDAAVERSTWAMNEADRLLSPLREAAQ